jgi:hypothetical protein
MRQYLPSRNEIQPRIAFKHTFWRVGRERPVQRQRAAIAESQGGVGEHGLAYRP